MNEHCCPIGRRADAAKIDEALRAGVPYRQVAAERGCPELAAAIYRHGGHLDQSTAVAPTEVVEPSPAPSRAPTEHATAELKQSAKQPEASEAEPSPTLSPRPTPSEPPARATQPARQLRRGPARRSVEEEQSETATRIRTIANLIALSSKPGMGWQGRRHIVGYAKAWGVPEEEVRRLHALAALRVKADRGTYAAQRELSVARVTGIIEEELATASMYDEAAKDAALQAAQTPGASKGPAKMFRMLAGMARSTALQAEQYLAKITFQRPKDPTTLLNVTYSSHPDFSAAAERLRVCLETAEAIGRTRQLVAFVHEGLSSWEQGGDVALDEWRREHLEASSMLLTQGDDGSYEAGAVA